MHDPVFSLVSPEPMDIILGGGGCIPPVLEEPLYAESHKLEQGLNDEDEREDVVAVLQNLL